jgi:hypothetical protein
VWTDFVSGREIKAMMEKWHKQPFSYSVPPMFVLNFFAREVADMRKFFEKYGREPFASDPKYLEQMNETRSLLGGDYWTLERWFKENGFDKKLKPTPTPLWKKVLAAGSVIVGVAAFFYYRR